jgi:hypothetical protein
MKAMDDANIVDFRAYREHKEPAQPVSDHLISDDLVTAIQLLIQRLRDKVPL